MAASRNSGTFLVTDADRFPLDDEDRLLLERSGFTCIEMPGHDPSQLTQQVREVDALLIYSAKITASIIAGMRRCKVLSRCGVGYDNIDVEAARKRRIQVTYVPNYGSVDVAEHALALILACSRRLIQSDRAVKAGRWPSYNELGTMRRLSGQALGLVGFGRIARCLAERASALGLLPLAYDPLLPREEIRNGGATPVTEQHLLQHSDFVSLHLPLTTGTAHWLNEERLAQMKRSAILINTSRGGVVDETALREALETGRLAAAGLDVLADEPPLPNAPLPALKNVILTPHSAAFTQEALAEVRKTAIGDALAVLRGETPRYPVPQNLPHPDVW